MTDLNIKTFRMLDNFSILWLVILEISVLELVAVNIGDLQQLQLS